MTTKAVQINADADVSEMTVGPDFLKITTPARIMIAGPTLSGKSEFMLRLVKYRDLLFRGKFDRIIFSHPSSTGQATTPFVDRLTECFPGLEVCVGLPGLRKDGLLDETESKMVLIDDQMLDLNMSREMVSSFIMHSHHSNITIVFTSQNVFFAAPNALSIRRNVSEFVLFYSKNDVQSLKTLSRQIFGKQLLVEAFEFLFKEFPDCPMRYVIIDCNQRTLRPREMNLFTNIFPDEDGEQRPIFFIDKK